MLELPSGATLSYASELIEAELSFSLFIDLRADAEPPVARDEHDVSSCTVPRAEAPALASAVDSSRHGRSDG